MVKVKEVVIEQAQALADQAEKLRKMPVEAARGAAARSADTVKSMREPVRALTRSGVKLTAISQSTVQRLIELQEQIITAAMSDAAAQLESAAGATSVAELARIQGRVLLAARERIVKDMAQASAPSEGHGAGDGHRERSGYRAGQGRCRERPHRRAQGWEEGAGQQGCPQGAGEKEGEASQAGAQEIDPGAEAPSERFEAISP